MSNQRPRLSDRDLLDLLDKGLLRVDLETLEVWKFHRHQRRFVRKKFWPHYKSGRMRTSFNKRTVYLNKLVWMAMYRRVVPDGCVVDHVNEDCTDDRLDNLRLMSLESSNKQGATSRNRLYRAMAFWDHIIWYGKPPSEEFCGITGAM